MNAISPLFAPLVAWPFGTLQPQGFNLIVADPPWSFDAWSENGHEKGAAKHYDCLPAEQIAERFPVGDLADTTCLLLCWGTFPLIDRQLACVQAWGFAFKSMFVWRKVFPSGATAMGPGYRVRSMAEPIILATRGEPQHAAFPGIFDGIRREHSRKPAEFYNLVSRCCPALRRRADLFARETRAGFAGWGHEAGKFDGAAA